MGEKKGKLILVTAINPTPMGEGKTTITVGLLDALRRLDKQAVAAIREPSLGPVFGVKGGAAGGGHAQVVPMEDINLHFTGDIHAITTANNLLAAMLDNHVFQGNALEIDTKRIIWRRCMDMNDRQLRNLVDGMGGRMSGYLREDGFDITAASEVMAVLCMAADFADLKKRLASIVVAYNVHNKPVTAGDLNAEGAMAAVLKDAIKPNMVQTLENSPVFVHGGPFANIAHGCNSVIATKMAMSLSDYVVTEAGFGADLGAEKFLDIKCVSAGLDPDAVVIVATVRALKYNGGVARENLGEVNMDALKAGFSNLARHISNISDVYGLPVVVAINKFVTDTDEEIALIAEECAKLGATAVPAEVWEKGGAGGEELAKAVVAACEKPHTFTHPYTLDMSLKEKIEGVAKKVYHAANVEFLPAAKEKLAAYKKDGFDGMPVCIAKTQYSFSDDPKKLGAPEGYTLTIRDLKVSAGAGFVVAYAGSILTMPGLPKRPAAEAIDVDDNGVISGLF